MVTIAGSYRKHLPRLLESAGRFRELGATVLRPRAGAVVDEDDEGADDFVRLEGDPTDQGAVHLRMFDAIDETALGGGILYVVNPGGYVGPSATANVAWAAKAGAVVVCQEPPYEAVVAVFDQGHPDLQLRSEEYALGLLRERLQAGEAA